jgi:hypothetical protein
LAKQLGISKKEAKQLLKLEKKTARGTGVYHFESLSSVSSINSYLNRKDVQKTNCANCAMGANGIYQPAADTKEQDYGGKSLDETPQILKESFENVNEKESSIGDVIAFNYSPERAVRKGSPEDYYNATDFTDRPNHYAVVLLKDKKGAEVKSILENTLIGTPKVVEMNEYNPSPDRDYLPSPLTNDKTPFYKKKN